jgi:hypothetical protein
MPFLPLVGALAWKMMRRASGRQKTGRSGSPPNVTPPAMRRPDANALDVAGQPANREQWFIMPVSLPNPTRVSTLIMLECNA